ncbi:hypothetical protein H8A95_15880 [Bradyrhizobium sp. Pear76]|nr:hypothetical protein [Bradyrhizobium oropedii]MCC8963750.1 hypothetical protein [Bradyrhizobium oropedii]
MPRHFGVRQGARDYWADHNGEPESPWPVLLMVVGVLAALVLAIFLV